MVVGIIPAVIMISLYSRVVCNLWFKKTNEFVQIAVRRSRKKVTKVALIVSVISVISWFPQLVVYLLSNYETGIKFGEFAYMASVVRESSFNMTRGGDEDMETRSLKF